LAALRKANVLILYDNIKDCFNLFDVNNDLMFSCTLDRAQNWWCIPYPFVQLNGSLVSAPVSVLSVSLFPLSICNSAPVMPVDPFITPLERIYPSTWSPEHLTEAEKSLLFWHRIFGHASLRKIRSLVKQQLGVGLPLSLPEGKIHCPVCAISKSTSLNPVASSMRKPDRLEILCTDLIGPFPVEIPDGCLYLLTLRDVATGYSYVHMLKTKDEANGVLMKIIPRLETQTQKKVKILCSNNGGEFANKALSKFLNDRGIIGERSLPYHHYQNGVIECFNRTVAEMGRTVLSDS
jgi:5'-3' exoribonuclease 2